MNQTTPARPPITERKAGYLRRLLPLLRPYRGWVATALLLAAAMLVGQIAWPMVLKMVIDRSIEAGRPDRLVPYSMLALTVAAGASLASFLRRNASGKVSLGVEFDLRNRLYRHMQSLPPAFHDGWQSGQLVSRAISDISSIRRFLGFGLMWIVLFFAQFVMTVAMMLRLDPALTAATTLCLLPAGVLNYRFRGRYKRISRRNQDQLGDLTTIVEESAVGVRIVKAFGRQAMRRDIFDAQARKVLETGIEGIGVRAHYWSLDGLVLNLGTALVVLVGGMRVADARLTLGGLIAFISYQLMLVNPIREVGWILAQSGEAFTAAERVYEVLDLEPDVADGPDTLDTCEGRVRFEHVSFAYPTSRGPIVRDLDLEIEPGETLALVGMTGSGKTTLASLVVRFMDPTAGRITLDGHDLRDLTLQSLRGHMGVAFEDPILFSASVRENLLMGNARATDEDLWEALTATQADEFVRDLPWALDTRVGEQGYSLSGGQRQRLALARAIVGGPRVLLLDDPLSAVDVHTEGLIEDALKRILKGRTAMLIAHRPSTLLLADRVALLHEGRIVGAGTHHDMLEDVPLYRQVLAQGVWAQEALRI